MRYLSSLSSFCSPLQVRYSNLFLEKTLKHKHVNRATTCPEAKDFCTERNEVLKKETREDTEDRGREESTMPMEWKNAQSLNVHPNKVIQIQQTPSKHPRHSSQN